MVVKLGLERQRNPHVPGGPDVLERKGSSGPTRDTDPILSLRSSHEKAVRRRYVGTPSNVTLL